MSAADLPAARPVVDVDALRLAIADPGATTPREANEQVTAWQVRAVLDTLRVQDAADVRRAVAEEALTRAADAVRDVRENGLPDGVHSHPVAEHFEKWLRNRAAREAGERDA